MNAAVVYAHRLIGLFMQAVGIATIVGALLRYDARELYLSDVAVYATFGLVAVHFGMALEARVGSLLHRCDTIVVSHDGGTASGTRTKGDDVAAPTPLDDQACRRADQRGEGDARVEVEPQRPDRPHAPHLEVLK